MGSIVRYTPEHFPLLERAARRLEPNHSLSHRPFVDYYYASSDWCRLYLYVHDDEVIGTIGLDSLRFEADGKPVMITFATNYYAIEPGAGAPLYMKWIRENPVALLFGGSEDTHRITRAQNWTYVDDVSIYELNGPIVDYPTDSPIRALSKRFARLLPSGVSLQKLLNRIPANTLARISLEEVPEFTTDMLPTASPFTFRFAPGVDYLNWRYNTGLSFVRYRMFRVLVDKQPVGYVVINDGPRTMAAQYDGSDATLLAHAVLLALAEVSKDDRMPRHVLLTSSHEEMQPIFRQFGFRQGRRGRPLAFNNFERHTTISTDTARWLVNLDWGDNGMRAPFLDQPYY